MQLRNETKMEKKKTDLHGELTRNPDESLGARAILHGSTENSS